MRVRGRLECVAAVPIIAVLACGPESSALAQTADYFATPWIAPATESPDNVGSSSRNAYSGLYARAQAQAEPNAPPWTLSEHLGIDEIATDNVADSQDNRGADLGSLFSAGAIATANTVRLNGVFSATGVYRQDLEDTALDRFSAYGFARSQATIIPQSLFFYVRGLADDVSRQGGGIENPLVQTSEQTHLYEISGSPFLHSTIDDFGVNVLRYQIGQVWFERNTGAVQIPGLTVGPISDSTNQLAREDLQVPGTVFPRLLADVSLSASENNSGPLGSGDFMRDRGELINEYEVTRSVSAIGGIGYERLNDNEFSNVDGESPVWDVGTRFRPNADSYALLIYGRHDLKSDFAGELVWRLTALTNIYAAYTDSITNGQQELIGSSDASELGPEGTLTRVAFDESTVIGTLDDALLSGTPGTGGAVSLVGVPLADINNALPLQDGLFRIKELRASAHTVIEGNPIRLTILHLERTQLTQSSSFGGQVGRIETSEGAILSWHPWLASQLSGLVGLHFEHVNLGTDELLPFIPTSNSDNYGATLGLTWRISRSLTGIARYDFVYRDAHSSSQSSYENALTIGLHKTFN